jgi:hypothetical protein
MQYINKETNKELNISDFVFQKYSTLNPIITYRRTPEHFKYFYTSFIVWRIPQEMW